VLLVLVTWLAIGQGQARSDTMLAFSSGNQQATATFAVSGNNLVVTLSNSFAPSANFKFDEGDVVGGVAFGTKGTAPNLTLVSAMTTSTIWTGNKGTSNSTSEIVSSYTKTTSPGADVGYSWAGTTNSGLSASGHSLPFGGFSFTINGVNNLKLFNTSFPRPLNYPNANGPQPGAVDFGLMPQNTTNFSYDHFVGLSFIQSSVVLTLGGWNGASLNSISGADFYWGEYTEVLSSGFVPNTAPEPSSMLLMAGVFAGLGVVGYRRRIRRAL
jgi:hypothetical protein